MNDEVCLACVGRGVRYGHPGPVGCWARTCGRCAGSGRVPEGSRNPLPQRAPVRPDDRLRIDAARVLDAHP